MTKAMTAAERRRRKKASNPAVERLKALSGVCIAATPLEPAGDPSPPQQQLARDHEAAGGKGTPKRYRFRDSPLVAAERRGTLSSRQVDAGDRWESAYRAAGGRTGPRSCLDMTPRGHSEAVTAREIDAARRWRDLSQAVGMIRGAVLHSVCVMHEPIGDCRARRHQQLSDGLDVTADFFGLPNDA